MSAGKVANVRMQQQTMSSYEKGVGLVEMSAVDVGDAYGTREGHLVGPRRYTASATAHQHSLISALLHACTVLPGNGFLGFCATWGAAFSSYTRWYVVELASTNHGDHRSQPSSLSPELVNQPPCIGT